MSMYFGKDIFAYLFVVVKLVLVYRLVFCDSSFLEQKHVTNWSKNVFIPAHILIY